jgi:sugar transferase EpsL
VDIHDREISPARMPLAVGAKHVNLPKRGLYLKGGKRFVDVMTSIVALLVLSPIILLISACILIFDGRPVLFKHTRPGLDHKPFELIKFRTMITDSHGSDASRTTRLGHWLRRFSLDEIPEFWNVLKGDMSVIGPRPLLFEYLASYTAEESTRHSIRPGLSGWAQVNGRNSLSLQEKVALDLWYIENVSLALDLRIAFETLATVVRQRGIDPTIGDADD